MHYLPSAKGWRLLRFEELISPDIRFCGPTSGASARMPGRTGRPICSRRKPRARTEDILGIAYANVYIGLFMTSFFKER